MVNGMFLIAAIFMAIQLHLRVQLASIFISELLH